MKVIQINAKQGSAEWKAGRMETYNASDAAAMLGLPGANETRTELLHRIATQAEKEFSDYVQKYIIDPGHEYEAQARQLAEEIIAQENGGDGDLYPVVLRCAPGEELPLGASLDGRTMNKRINWEHKTLNAKLAESLDAGVIPDEYHPQMEQGFILSQTADKCLFMASNGDRSTMRYAWYYPNPELRERILAGWSVLDADRRGYVPPEVIPAAVAEPQETLPAVFLQVEGRVVAGDMRAHRATVSNWVASLPAVFETDQDFENGAAAVKHCAKAESDLKSLASQVRGQMASVDEVFRLIEESVAEIAAARLRIDKAVKAEKENRKNAIVRAGQDAMTAYIAEVNASIGGMLPAQTADFQGAIRGLKTLKSITDAVGSELARVKAAADIKAASIRSNLDVYGDLAPGYEALFPDLKSLVLYDQPAFRATVENRIAKAKADAEAKLEADRARIRAEERERVEREVTENAQAKAQAEQDAENASTSPQIASEIAPSSAQEPAQQFKADDPQCDGKTMKLGDINARLGFTMTADFLASIGFPHVDQERAAKLYLASSFPAICQAIAQHVLRAGEDK